jgi:hypothetical protein
MNLYGFCVEQLMIYYVQYEYLKIKEHVLACSAGTRVM